MYITEKFICQGLNTNILESVIINLARKPLQNTFDALTIRWIKQKKLKGSANRLQIPKEARTLRKKTTYVKS